MSDFLLLRRKHTPSEQFLPIKEVLLRRGAVLEGEELNELVFPVDVADFRRLFDGIAQRISRRIRDDHPLHILVDEIDASSLNPLVSQSWSGLIAMLILAFPDVRWTFCVIRGCPDRTKDEQGKKTDEYCRWLTFRARHGLSSLTAPRATPLFDGHGLRQWVICQINTHSKLEGKGAYVAERPYCAVVLDEERSYSQFSALMAYHNGFRVHAVETWREAKSLLDSPDSISTEDAEILLTIEDLYLNFPDQGAETGNSDLENRGKHLKTLALPSKKKGKEAENQGIHRRFLTVGHRKNKDEVAKRRKNWRILAEAEKRQFGRNIKHSKQVVLKPATGLYALWEGMGLSSTTWTKGGVPTKSAPGYSWPPVFDQKKDDEGHSANGRLEQIAEFLLDRAKSQLPNSNAVSKSIRGAVLASQALELLGCKTPPLSQEALSLKHRFEVMAECQFPGVEYHLSMDKRVADIKLNLKALSKWLRPKRRRDFRYNGGAQILSRLINILEEFNEFEEAEFCRGRVRSLHRRIELRDAWKQQRPGKFFVTLVLGTYTDWVLRSLTHFAVTWLALLGFYFFLFAVTSGWNWFEAQHQAVYSLLTINIYEGPKAVPSGEVQIPEYAWWYPISYFAAATGALNIGLLITHLYGRISRR